ncbi:MAG TPA: fibronectin type III domain-containing protein [Tepidisphaeraceae bacterium]
MTKRRQQPHRIARATLLEELESRLLMHFDPHDPDHFDPVPLNPILRQSKLTPHVGPFKSATAAGTIPALNSDPDATAQLFLDFNGADAMTWGQFTTTQTPSYDTDGDPGTFTAGELTNIQQIWSRVSEAYSPFNINVTTVDPGNLDDHVTTRVVVGGNGSWYGAAGGVAYVGAFSNSAPNIAWVFPAMLSNGNVKFTSDAIEHEAGHTFGLQHQSVYSGTKKTNEYNPGSAAKAPIMGNSYSASRSLWWSGQSSISSSTIQNDVSVISSVTNGFGYRTDDHGSTIGTADPTSISDSTATASGIIEQISDKDYFSFSTLQGPVSFSVTPATFGGMLDATLQLVSSVGTVITTANTSSLGETINSTVAAGQYYLIVSSHGTAGDIGQYELSGTIVTSPNFVAPPTGLTATASNGNVSLHWTDMSWNETGFQVQRSGNGGSSYDTVTTTDANTSSYTDTSADVGTSYLYRIKAVGDAEDSDFSPTATVNVTPATPAGLAATSASATQINLGWSDVEGETGYRLDRSLNNSTWATLTTLGADATSYENSGLVAGTKYYYRVVATSGVGNSTASASVNSTTRPLAPATVNGTPTAVSIALSWTNVAGETGYKIERSLNNSDWSQIATTAANAVTYTNTALSANTTYYYRVKATNAGGESQVSPVLTKKTLLVAPTGLAASVESTSEIDLTWNASEGATGYRVEKLSGTTWAQIGDLLDADATGANVTGLTAGGTYSLRLRAMNDGGPSAPSSAVTGTTIPPAPATITATAISPTQIKATWTNVPGETGYSVERSSNGTDWSQIASTGANIATYTDFLLDADTVYYYRAKGSNAAGTGEASASANTRTLLDPPQNVTATVFSTTQIDLTWDDWSSETAYKVEKLVGTTWTQVGDILAADTTSKSVTGLTPGGTYSLRVRAINSGGTSAGSPAVVATTIPPKPSLSGAVFSSTQINLSWSNVAGENGYKIERSPDGSDWTEIGTKATNVLTYSDTGLEINTSYQYRVRAYNAAGNSEYSAVATKKTLLSAPMGLSASVDSASQIHLSWDNSDGETGYKIERLAGTTWVQVGAALAADVTEANVTALSGGTAYSFRLRAVNEGGTSAPSSTATATTKPAAPTTIAATVIAADQVRLGWSNVTGETGFRLQRSTNGSDWDDLTTVAANVLTITDTGLMPGTYYYRVIAFNASGDSSPGPTISKVV